MIRTIDIRLNAAHPELPLPEATTYQGAPSTAFLRGVPKACGQWQITAINVAVTFPDNSTTTRAAVLSAGDVWVVTIPACATSGRTVSGLRILADGLDENGDAVTGYVLGVADLAVATFDIAPAPGVTSYALRYFDNVPNPPHKGDVAKVDNVLKYYDGTAWQPFADLSDYYTAAQVDEAIDKLAAYYITYNATGAAFPTRAALLNAQTYYSGGVERTPTRNDYAVVLADETHDGAEWRYIYAVPDGQTAGQWEAQYPIETNDYDALSNKPQINGHTLSGNKTAADLGLAPAGNYATKADATLTERTFSAWELDYSAASLPGPIDRIEWNGYIWIAALQRVCGASKSDLASYATVTWAPGEWGSGTTSELVGTWTGDHWEPSIAEYDGYPLVIFGSRSEATPAQEMTGGVAGEGSSNPNTLELQINVANTWPNSGGSGTVVATRTALQGYQLGSQASKPLASEAEAEALRQGKLDKSGGTMSGDITLDYVRINFDSGVLHGVSATQGNDVDEVQFLCNDTGNALVLKVGNGGTLALTADIPYSLGTPTVIDTASSETVEGETVNYGAATLANRTANQVIVLDELDELRVTIPPAVSGKVRDFGLIVVVGLGVGTALAAPALVPIAPTGETIAMMNAEGEMPTLADGTTTASGMTVLYFSEVADGTFLVKGEQLKQITQ